MTRRFHIEHIEMSQGVPYSVVVFSTSYLRLFDSILEVEAELFSAKAEGPILFDQLTCNGNTSNRFIEASFEDGKIDFWSLRQILPADETVTWCDTFYRFHPEYMKHSVKKDI